MGNNEEVKPLKTEKPTSPAPPDQANVRVYPDWAAMQAYYGTRMAMPPYYNPPVASGAGGHTPPPYMWGPQPMMPPYGAPYAAMYPPGGMYAHLPLGSQSHGQNITSSPIAATPLSIETPSKSGNGDQSLMKKLKSFDGLAMSIGNGTTVNTEGGAEHKLSQSEETESSIDGTDEGNTTETDQTRRKRSRETNVGSTNVTVSAKLELKNPATPNAQPCSVLPPEAWTQNEKDLKRERRKQSNRESARRSRLRKQAETEELARKVEALTSENMSLKFEINQLNEKSDKLRLENSSLVGKLNNVQLGRTHEGLKNVDDYRAQPTSTENLLSKVSNSGSVEGNLKEEDDKVYDKKTNSGARLHQLLDANSRADPVAAT